MMHAEKKRLAAVFVGGAVPATTAAAAVSKEERGGLSSTKAAGPTFQVWSRDNHAFCTECEDTRATVLCEHCDEPYCSLCWAALHRRGERAKHSTTPLGSEEDLSPPPEAVEGSGWLAGVWPSQKPAPKPGPRPAAEAPSTPSSAPSSTETAPNGASKYIDGDGGSAFPAGIAAAAGLNDNGGSSSSSNSGGGGSRGAGPQEETGSGKSVAGASAAAVAAAAANEPRKPAAPADCSGAAAAGAGAGAGALARNGNGTRNGNGNGNGSATAAAAGTLPKKPKLNGTFSALAATPPPPSPPATATATTSAGASSAADATPASPQGAPGRGGGSGSGSGRGTGSRPDGYEGPLCSSGEFFSKPQTPPPPSPPRCNGTKRPRSPPPLPEATGERPGTDKSIAAAAAAAAAAAEAPHSSSNGRGLGLDKNGEAEGRGQGQGQGRSLGERATSAAAGGSGGGSGNGQSSSAVGTGCGSNGHAGLHSGQGRVNGCSGSAAAAAGAGRVATEPPPGEDVEDMDIDAPLFSAAAMAAAAAGAGSKVDVAMPPLPVAAAGEKNGGGVAVGGVGTASVGGGDAAVGPAREATAAEKRSLADMKRRSTNIPLRLDPRERAVLGVLEGSLHHMQYTDAVDRILRGRRLECVLENLKYFFTSVFGMYKASGVPPPTYTPPASNNGFGGAVRRHGGMPASRAAFPVLPPPDGRGGSSSSISNGGSGGGWSVANGRGRAGVTAAGGAGGEAGGEAGGGASYRRDSFVHKKVAAYTLDWACILRTCCEVGRRHKILNPEKMRSGHGMLMCILMDTEHPQVVAQTGFSCVRPMRTAFGLSASTSLSGLFDDPDLLAASRPVLPWERDQKLKKGGRSAEEMAVQAKEKAEARRRLVARHGTGGLSCEVTLLVDSVADSIVYREISTRPIRRMMSLLKHHWDPDRQDDPSRRNISLAINCGEFGARLTHSHKAQFYFVLQSLSLWLEVVDHMLDLWAAGERDMLDEHNQYSLINTGQGLQRVQGAGRVGKRMREYQSRVHKATGHPWVGSAVVHLGDNCVPNALTFLDKYSQVPWILNPILQAVDFLSELDAGSDHAVMGYIKRRWTSAEYAQRYILRNFFRFGFDGSGGDNNYDAGSCVDGRLTSAWNWCSKLEKKSYVSIFMMSGFSGFDGDFSR